MIALGTTLSSSTSSSGNFPRCSSEKEYLGVSIVQFQGEVRPLRYKGFQIPSPLTKREVGTAESFGSRLTPSPCSMIVPVLLYLNPQEDDAKFLGFSHSAEDGPSRAGRFSKTFPEVPIEFHVPGGKEESRLFIPGGTRNTHGLIGNVGYSRAARSSKIIKFSCVVPGIHLVLQVLNLSQKPIHGRKIRSLFHGEFIDFQMSGFIRFLSQQVLRNSSMSWQSLRDLLGRVHFSFPILRTNVPFLFEPDKSVGAPDRVLWDSSCRRVSKRAISTFRLSHFSSVYFSLCFR